MDNVVDMCRKIKDAKIPFVLNFNNSWETFEHSLSGIVNTAWLESKFLDDSGTSLHPDMNRIPSDTGGIYIFIAKPELVPQIHLYILYIGRAKITARQNLKKRCNEYIGDSRLKINSMISSLGKYLYIKYLPLNDNDIIDRLEKELINRILPPFNDEIPDKTINRAMKAWPA